MAKAQFRPHHKQIVLRGDIGSDKAVDAYLVGERVAVHEAFWGNGFTISDPVSGLAYHWSDKWTAASARRKAQAFVREFGSNPLKGMILDVKRGECIRKPARAKEMREWFRKGQR